jgi:cell filamentation protein
MPESLDPYTYPGTNVLRNTKDIRDRELLDAFESNAAWSRLTKLEREPLKGRFDTAHLKAIHKSIFQDVYTWAGEFRTVDMSKGGSFFARAAFIEMTLHDLLRRLPAEDLLRKTSPAAFAERSGFYLAELNAIHPFREGNGRAQREFIRDLAIQAGFDLDWRKVTREQMTIASRLSFASGDSFSIAKVIEACLG